MDQDDRLATLEKKVNKLEKYLLYLAVGKKGTDPAYFDAEVYVKNKKSITSNQLQKHLEIGYSRTSGIMDLLEKNNKIGPKEKNVESRICIKSE